MASGPQSKPETVAWIFQELEEIQHKVQYVQSALKESPLFAPVGSNESKELEALLGELNIIRMHYRDMMPLKHRLCQRYQLRHDPVVDQYYTSLGQTTPDRTADE